MLNILLVDDHELFRGGVMLLLGDLASEIKFVEASSCSAAIALAESDVFDLVLLDMHLPGVSGLEALRAIRAVCGSAVIVVVSSEASPDVIRQMIDAGAAGYVPKASSPAIMMAALRLILAGGTYLPPDALSVPFEANGTGHGSIKSLTPRQIDTLRLAIKGLPNKLIARQLDISEATVKAHLSASFRALEVKNRTEAVFAAAKMGLTGEALP